MIKVYETGSGGDNMYSVRQTISTDMLATEEAVSRAKEMMVMDLARKLLDKEKHFYSRVIKVVDTELLEVGSDLVIMTMEEYFDLVNTIFARGRNSTKDFVPKKQGE